MSVVLSYCMRPNNPNCRDSGDKLGVVKDSTRSPLTFTAIVELLSTTNIGHEVISEIDTGEGGHVRKRTDPSHQLDHPTHIL